MTTNQLRSNPAAAKAPKPYKGLPMEGLIATWYARNTRQGREFNTLAQRLHALLPAGSRVLEVAPGPGYLAVELAKLDYQVVGLDISKTFVEIAQATAREAGVAAEFRQGNAAAMPFGAEQFDFAVCCAAFKNFTEPVEAIRELHRVLKPGGQALIADLRRDASQADINAAVDKMGMNWFNRLLTKWIFRHTLLKNAYTQDEIRAFVAQTKFGTAEIRNDDIGMEIWLAKEPVNQTGQVPSVPAHCGNQPVGR